MFTTRRFLGFVLIALAPAATVQAVTTKTTTFIVQAQITADCTIGATLLDFGDLGLLTAAKEAQTSIIATCTNTTPYTLSLDKGSAPASQVTDRLLKHATTAATLHYQLYRDDSRTQIWGDTVSTNTVSGTGTGGPVTHIVYGRVPPSVADACARAVSIDDYRIRYLLIRFVSYVRRRARR